VVVLLTILLMPSMRKKYPWHTRLTTILEHRERSAEIFKNSTKLFDATD
jgi:hypothetical protein